MKGLAVAVALLGGMMLAVQVGANNGLRSRLGSPILAALISFTVGTVLLLAYLAILRPSMPPADDLRHAPWWTWIGGALGAVYVASAAMFGARLGAAGWLGLIVTGQIVTSIVLDHFGLVGFNEHPAGFWRIVGAVLLLAGVVIVLRN